MNRTRPGIKPLLSKARPAAKELPKRSWLRVVWIEPFFAGVRRLGSRLMHVGR